MPHAELAKTIDEAFERREHIGPTTKGPVREARVVKNAAGRVIHAETWFTHYVLWNGRIEVGS